VDETTATSPEGRRDRLVRLENQIRAARSAGASSRMTSPFQSSSLAARRTCTSLLRCSVTHSRTRRSCVSAWLTHHSMPPARSFARPACSVSSPDPPFVLMHRPLKVQVTSCDVVSCSLYGRRG
jgi:hypothetical protein